MAKLERTLTDPNIRCAVFLYSIWQPAYLYDATKTKKVSTAYYYYKAKKQTRALKTKADIYTTINIHLIHSELHPGLNNYLMIFFISNYIYLPIIFS